MAKARQDCRNQWARAVFGWMNALAKEASETWPSHDHFLKLAHPAAGWLLGFVLTDIGS